MLPHTTVQTAEPPAIDSTPAPARRAASLRARLRAVLSGVTAWSRAQFDRENRPRLTRKQLGVISTAILLLAVGIRLLSWQDSYAEIAQGGSRNSAIARHYESEARRMLDEGGILLPTSPVDAGDARPILHPPGYSALMAGVFALAGGSISSIRLVQIIADALSAVLVLLIAAELFSSAVAIISALLVALSPHFAFYSLWISPDTLCVLPLLAAIYLFVKAGKQQPRVMMIVASGLLIGLSCWLRSNALLLAPFLAIGITLLFKRGNRLKLAGALVGSMLVTISPITIRNFILYRQFIPVSLGAGATMVEGIADYDKEQIFGMASTDDAVARMDAQWFARSDYAANPWAPDGVERDRARLSRGVAVARSNPGWFLGVMFRRAAFMLSYSDSRRHDWPFGTSTVPILAAEAPFSHPLPASTEMIQPTWSHDPDWLIADGSVISPLAQATLADDGRSMQITGDGSDFGDQVASAMIAVKKDTDYVLNVPITIEQGHLAAKVTTEDRRIALASIIIPGVEEQDTTRAKKKSKQRAESPNGDFDSAEQRRPSLIQIPFATGKRNDVRLVLSNNGAGPASVAQIGRVELIDTGPTPHIWTQYPRSIVRGLQKTLFTTARMVPLVIVGLVLLATARRGRELAILLAVPLYYLCTQSVLHTEYRYILAIHYFLFVIAATTLTCFGVATGQASRWIAKRFARPARG